MSDNTHVKPPRRLPTDEELMDLPKDGYKRELLQEKIVMTPAGSEHGRKITRFSTALATFIYDHQLGEVFDGQTGFRMKNGDVLSPDISFVSRGQLLEIGGNPEGFFEGAPELVIEFLSPRESKKRMQQKLIEYFDAGCRLAWVMNTKTRTIAVHRSGPVPENVLTEADQLSGEEVIGGFRIAVAAIFDEPVYRRH